MYLSINQTKLPKSDFCERGRIGLELLQSMPEDVTEIMVQLKEKIHRELRWWTLRRTLGGGDSLQDHDCEAQ